MINTVDSRLFEPALIRIIRLFEVRWHSPWICLTNSGKNTFDYSNFSYSNFQLFEGTSIPLGSNYRLNHPQLFEFLLLGDRRVRTLIFCAQSFFFFKKSGFNIYGYLHSSSNFFNLENDDHDEINTHDIPRRSQSSRIWKIP